MIGDKQSLGGKWGGILFQALIVGSLFYDMPNNASGENALDHTFLNVR